ncbi:zinc finger and SCAN domain-containing protein 2-like isoform X3 [Corythoichthys intestinalis]|uniref:zinc finger and SCAN domain-containing protein 2-like isoform X3 n=1 Tax=Corythoichthys intestinalis TaxID=161448 RepID=UPI0025A53038|nr:zinc finger and SCAN domain-containing protein 2-like isoform X3 [Corythoichthys intestinalis]
MEYIKQEEESETPNINEEQEDEIPRFPMTVDVKSEESEVPSKESGAVKPSNDGSFQHLSTKEEGRSQPYDVTVEDLHPEKHDPPHVKQEESNMAYIKQEAEPESPSIKEEKQEEEIMFPMPVAVKSEDDDEGHSKGNGAAKPSKDSSFQHLRTKDVTVEDLHTEKHYPLHVKREESNMAYIKQEAEPESPSIKEEKQEEEIMFPMPVAVKSEDDDEGPSGSAKPSKDSSFQHLTTKDVTVEDLHPEEHVKREESNMAYIKQEAEPESPSMKEEKQEEEIIMFPMTVCVKSEEDDEGPSGAAKPSSDSSFQHLTTKDVTVEDLHLEKHVKREESNMAYIKQEAEPESCSIKEEKQEEEIIMFPMTVGVKSEEEDEGLSGAAKPSSDSSFQLLTTKDVTLEDLHLEKHVKWEESNLAYIKQEAEPVRCSIKEGKQEEEIIMFPMTVAVKSVEEDEGLSGAAKPSSNSSFQHLTTKGEGQSQPDDLLAPLSDTDDVMSHSSVFDTDEEDVDSDASKSLNKSSLKRETKECAGGKPFSCSHCDKTFTTKEHLIKHMNTLTEEKPYVCTFCGKRFGRKGTLKIHIRTHTGEKTFVCSVCDKRLRTKQALTSHTRTHTGEKPFVCTFCGKRFGRKEALKRHTREHTGEKPFVCTFCGKRFGQKEALKRHTMTHTGEKPFICSLCDKKFCTKQALTRHTRTHTGEKPFVCTFCGKRFAQQGTLQKHTRTHTGDEPIACSVYDKRFRTNYQFTRHTRTHTGEKPFVCSLCDKKFCSKEELTRHTRTHTKEKPFACSLCDKKFRTNYELTRHTRTHTGEKPFVCSLCDKKFFSKEELTKHTKTHTKEKPFACSLCDKRFRTNYELTRHTRTHTGEKPFICSLCDKKYCSKDELTRHTRTHTKEKPFACSLCDKRFGSKHALTQHTRIHIR